MGLVAPQLCRRSVRQTQYRAAGSCTGAVADWSRVRILLNGEPQLFRDGELLSGLHTLDLRRGLLLSELSYRTRAGIAVTGN